MTNLTEIRREDYLQRLGLSEHRQHREARERALEKSYELRNFEIEHYWKRASYFWAYQAVIFTAIGFLGKEGHSTDWGIVPFALALIGLITAIANLLSSLGSKFWQENWERHIDLLEDEFDGKLYKTSFFPRATPSYSVSKINILLAGCFAAFWIVVASKLGVQYCPAIMPLIHLRDLGRIWPVCGLASATAVAVLKMLCLKTSVGGNLQPNSRQKLCLSTREPPQLYRL